MSLIELDTVTKSKIEQGRKSEHFVHIGKEFGKRGTQNFGLPRLSKNILKIPI